MPQTTKTAEEKNIKIRLDRDLFFGKSDFDFDRYTKDFNFWTNKIWGEFLDQVKHAKKDDKIYNKLNNTEFKNRLKKALQFIGENHVIEGHMQLRSCGNFFINHPMRQCFTAIQESQSIKTHLPRLKVRDILISIILHDIVEDGENISINDIKKMFGQNIAQIVDTVTKTSTAKEKEQKTTENMQALFAKAGENPAGLITKMYDVRDNIRTLSFIPNKCRRARITLEALRFYVPISEIVGSLGLRHFREIKKLVLKQTKELLEDVEMIQAAQRDSKCQEQYEEMKEKYNQRSSIYEIDRYIRVGDNNPTKFLSNLLKKLSQQKTASDMEYMLFDIVQSLDVQTEQDQWTRCQEEDNMGIEKRVFRSYKLQK